MNTRLSLFNSPLLLGFENIERMLDRSAKSASDSYPPYNIEKRGEDGFRITLAVAGFKMEELSIQLEDNQLTITGQHAEEAEEGEFLHRGIANRAFRRSFVLAEGIEVTAAALDNGLLHVELHRPTPEVRVRTVPISTGKPAN